MKKKLLIAAAGLIAVIIAIIIYILIIPIIRPTIPLDNAQQLYSEAYQAVASAHDLALHINKIQETTIGTDIFCEISQQELHCTGLGTENMQLDVTEDFSIGNHTITFSESYSDNTAYVVINNTGFSCPISADEYLKRFAPAALLNPALYGAVSGVDNREQYVINFSLPTGAENWALDDHSAFTDAVGTAYISYDGQLTKSIYKLTYSSGKAQIRITYTVEIAPCVKEIKLPNNAASFHTIDYLDGPKMLERASGYLLQTNHISAHYTDSIYFQAFGDARTQDITLYEANHEKLTALVKTLTTLKNDSRVGQDIQLNKVELFADGDYLVSIDGNEPEVNSVVTADDMHQYCQNRLVSTVMLPEHITGAQIVAAEESVRIQYSASDEFAKLISSNACQALYQQPELLNDLAQSRTTDTLQCYLELDKITGLPIASGISYSGTHTIENTPYSLSYQADQIYDLLSQITTEEIKKAAG